MTPEMTHTSESPIEIFRVIAMDAIKEASKMSEWRVDETPEITSDYTEDDFELSRFVERCVCWIEGSNWPSGEDLNNAKYGEE